MRLKRFLDKYADVFDITMPDGDLYLRRYTLLSVFGFKLMVHYIRRPDYAEHLHDHPWRFWTLILKGGYKEKTPDGVHTRKPWRIYFHGIGFQHHITELLDGPAWTLVFRGRRIREWGFITECGWKHWQHYVDKIYNYLPICEDETPSDNRRERRREVVLYLEGIIRGIEESISIVISTAGTINGAMALSRLEEARKVYHEKLRKETEVAPSGQHREKEMRGALEIGIRNLQLWLDMAECDCEDMWHICGRRERERDLERMKQALSTNKTEGEGS